MTCRQNFKCAVDGCDRRGLSKRKGMCSTHYFQEYGRKKGKCKSRGCTRNQYSRGYCSAHYQRLLKGSEKGIDAPIKEITLHHGELCSVAGCSRFASKKQFCETHYTANRRSKAKLHQIGKPNHIRERKARPGYKNVHARLRGDRGPALNYTCVDCGRPALDWSYQYGAPDERRDEKTGFLFSADQSYYVPRCRSCNLSYDKRHRDQASYEVAA